MSKRSKRLVGQIGRFIQQYARKTQKAADPNDRTYSGDLERKIKKMSPEELDRLMRDEDNGSSG